MDGFSKFQGEIRILPLDRKQKDLLLGVIK
jgi:hypothetical protein